MACSTKDTGYGRCVEGLMHMVETVDAISVNFEFSAVWRSFSDNWNSPFSKIYEDCLLLSEFQLSEAKEQCSLD